MPAGLNLIGKKFDKLLVESRAESAKGQRRWNCVCECGNRITHDSATLFRKNCRGKTCGKCDFRIRANQKDLKNPGDKIGNITIISREWDVKNGITIYKYLCDCGKSGQRWHSYINKSTSCGCKSVTISKTGHGEIHGTFWAVCKKGASLRNINFNISIEEAWVLFQKQNSKCALSGQDLCFYKKVRSASVQTASLDRINSNLPYSIDNCQWVHKDINIMKWNFSQDRFIELCGMISNSHSINHNIYFDNKILSDIKGHYWSNIIGYSRRVKRDFSISKEYALKIFNNQKGKCRYTGLDLKFYSSKKDKKEQTASLDRIDSSKGYIEGNVQWVHKDINKMKLDFSENEFIEICNKIYKYQTNKDKNEKDFVKSR